MANFQASIINPSTGLPDITTSGTQILFVDHSNYDTNTEAGHAQSDFSLFREVKIINPDGTSYINTATIPDVATLPIVDTDNYTTGDGVYDGTLYVLPTYNSGVAYDTSTIPYTYYQGNMFQCLISNTGHAPKTSYVPGTQKYWQVIYDIDLLPTKYRIEQKFVIVNNLQLCFANKEAAAMCNIDGCVWNNLPQKKNFADAQILNMILNYIPYLVNNGNWSEVTNLINMGKKICCCK